MEAQMAKALLITAEFLACCGVAALFWLAAI